MNETLQQKIDALQCQYRISYYDINKAIQEFRERIKEKKGFEDSVFNDWHKGYQDAMEDVLTLLGEEQ